MVDTRARVARTWGFLFAAPAMARHSHGGRRHRRTRGADDLDRQQRQPASHKPSWLHAQRGHAAPRSPRRRVPPLSYCGGFATRPGTRPGRTQETRPTRGRVAWPAVYRGGKSRLHRRQSTGFEHAPTGPGRRPARCSQAFDRCHQTPTSAARRQTPEPAGEVCAPGIPTTPGPVPSASGPANRPDILPPHTENVYARAHGVSP